MYRSPFNRNPLCQHVLGAEIELRPGQAPYSRRAVTAGRVLLLSRRGQSFVTGGRKTKREGADQNEGVNNWNTASCARWSPTRKSGEMVEMVLDRRRITMYSDCNNKDPAVEGSDYGFGITDGEGCTKG